MPGHQLDGDVDTDVAEDAADQCHDGITREVELTVGAEARDHQHEHHTVTAKIEPLGLIAKLPRPVATQQQENEPTRHGQPVVDRLHAEAERDAGMGVAQRVRRDQDRSGVADDHPPLDGVIRLLLDLPGQPQADERAPKHVAERQCKVASTSGAEPDAEVEDQVGTNRENNVLHLSLQSACIIYINIK